MIIAIMRMRMMIELMRMKMMMRRMMIETMMMMRIMRMMMMEVCDYTVRTMMACRSDSSTSSCQLFLGSSGTGAGLPVLSRDL